MESSSIRCSHCLKSPASIYCCCEQLWICQNCKPYHEDKKFHALLDQSSIEIPTSTEQNTKDKIKSYLASLKKQLESKSEYYLSKLNTSRVPIKPSSCPLSFNLKIDEYFKAFLSQDQESVYYYNGKFDVFKLDVSSRKTSRVNVELDKISNSNSLWLIKWKNNLIRVGGKEDLRNRMKTITIYSHGDGRKYNIDIDFPYGRFYPLVIDDMLYVIGGREITNYATTKIVSKFIYEYDLNSRKINSEYTMKKQRYGIAACFGDNVIYIMSSNIPNNIELFHLKNKTSEEKDIDCRIDENSGLAYYNASLYLFTTAGMYQISLELEKKILINFSNLPYILGNDWNEKISPVIRGGVFYCFSSHKIFSYDLNSDEIQKFEYNQDE